MDVVDEEDEDDFPNHNNIPTSSNAAKAPPVVPSKSKIKSIVAPSKKSVLSPEEARVVAMEQIAGLTHRQKKKKDTVKPADSVDLVTALGADWSDDDTNANSNSDQAKTLSGPTAGCQLTAVSKVQTLSKTSIATTSPTATAKTTATTIATVLNTADGKQRKTSPKQSKAVAKSCSPNQIKPVPTTGFKRTRIIKRKIIWDPDAPETQISYAQLVRSTPKTTTTANKLETCGPIEKTTTTTTTGLQSAIATKTINPTLGKKDVAVPAKRMRPNTPREKKLIVVLPGDTPATEKKISRPVTPGRGKITTATTNTTVATADNSDLANKTSRTGQNNNSTTAGAGVAVVGDSQAKKVVTLMKKRPRTPMVINGVVGGNNCNAKKKKITEIDRLMGDEGAANMLNALESERNKLDIDQNGSDGDKPHKPMMRSRSTTLTGKTFKKEVGNSPIRISPGRMTTTALSQTSTTTTTPNTPKTNKRNTNKQKPSDTWDYVYKQKASEEAMIIRRRSNSSYSSSASLHRLSLDGPGSSKSSAAGNGGGGGGVDGALSAIDNKPTTSSTTITTLLTAKPTKTQTKLSNADTRPSLMDDDTSIESFEFAKPESKNVPIGIPTTMSASSSSSTSSSSSSSVGSSEKSDRRVRRGCITGNSSDMKKARLLTRRTLGSEMRAKIAILAAVAGDIKSVATGASGVAKTSITITEDQRTIKQTDNDAVVAIPVTPPTTSDFIVKKAQKVAQIFFNTHKAKIDFTFTAQMMNKVVDILAKLSKDKDCNVVVMLTQMPHFCQGIDFSELTVGNIEKRKQTASAMAMAVKNYLKALLKFPKPLLVGVKGSNIGLGVTQLPLFDIVVCSDRGTFETPYAKFGQIPEGYCLWNVCRKIRSLYKTKLFWLCEKLSSAEFALSGLVHKLATPDKVNEEAINLAQRMAALSPESYRVMKSSALSYDLDGMLLALDKEFETIVEQWTSTECYEQFKNYLESGLLF